MAETITANAADSKGSLIRRRNMNSGECANWTTLPGFRYAEAKDLILNGVVYKTLYDIYGEGLPSTNYANATAGSTYTDTVYGHQYRALFDDTLTLMWALTGNIILQSEGDTAIGNIDIHPMGQLLQDSDDAKLYIKTNAAAAAGSGTNIVVGAQT